MPLSLSDISAMQSSDGLFRHTFLLHSFVQSRASPDSTIRRNNPNGHSALSARGSSGIQVATWCLRDIVIIFHQSPGHRMKRSSLLRLVTQQSESGIRIQENASRFSMATMMLSIQLHGHQMELNLLQGPRTTQSKFGMWLQHNALQLFKVTLTQSHL